MICKTSRLWFPPVGLAAMAFRMALGLALGLGTMMSSDVVAQNNSYDADAMARINPRYDRPMPIDEQRVAAAGIRRVSGKHLVLYTDLREQPEIDEFVATFDQATEQWCQVFSVDPKRAEKWQMRCFLIEDRPRFRAAQLMPNDLPDFLAGYQRRHEMWIYRQPGSYYTRHLLLHEGTHAFMEWFLDGYGSPWYSEGIAEKLGLHWWQNEQLKLGYRLRDRSEAPYWGRIKIIRREFAEGTMLSLDDVFNIPNRAFREVRNYAWGWAACEFLSNHQLSQKVFADLFQHAKKPQNLFNASLIRSLDKHWEVLNRDWYLFISELEYGYDVSKGRIVSATKLRRGDTIENAANIKGDTFGIRSEHSWQKTSLEVKAGQRIRVTCNSRFQIGTSQIMPNDDGMNAEESKNGQPINDQPWPCEANGITLEYYRGRPLGTLMAGVLVPRAEAANVKESVAGLLDPMVVGQNAIIEIRRSGILCFRVNESPAKLADNQGSLEVAVEKLE